MKEKLTPMMQQFFDLKKRNPDAVLLFRCGDFYETYGEDAVLAAEVLGITLTRRNNGKGTSGDTMEMAGFPYHAIDTYLPRLIRAGHRVAVCDQLEDPKLTKKLVKRGITELVTPGVALTDTVLSAKENNFLCAVHFGSALVGVSFLDISTGEFLLSEGDRRTVEKLLQSMCPREVLVLHGMRGRFESMFGGGKFCIYQLDDWCFSSRTAHERLTRHFSTKSLKGFGVTHMQDGIVAAGAVLCYLELTEHRQLKHITSLRALDEHRYVRMDAFTVRNLEIVSPMQSEGTTLRSVLDHTQTPMGGRLLTRWLLFPLQNVEEIRSRHDAVETFLADAGLSDVCDMQLPRQGDLERLAQKVAVGRASPRDLQALRTGLEATKVLQFALSHVASDALCRMAADLDALPDLSDAIERHILPEPALLPGRGDVIASGVSEELDELRTLSHDARGILQDLQRRESDATGIPSLKIGYNNVFGYYLEVRNTYKDRVPETWIRKQTLAGAERYITPELKELEERIVNADERISALEIQIFNRFVQEIQTYVPSLQKNAHTLATLDCLRSYAIAAGKYGYARPVMDDGLRTEICGGRHPVIERCLPQGEEYVPADVLLDATPAEEGQPEPQQIIILTGPNMAGKSALLRQTALITLMAQAGSFVPAKSAHLGVVDKIFTRVGASDSLSTGESTFMVEMTEAASILNSLTPHSLVLFDELGRGTSTYDGISIAWAIVEHLHEMPSARARTLFATHYHELNDLAAQFPRIRNFHISIHVEPNGRILFTRKVEAGGSEHSFGIHVGALAGLPPSVVRRAEEILHTLEAAAPGADGMSRVRPDTSAIEPPREAKEMKFFQLDDPVLSQVRDEILTADINALTPLEALNKLAAIKRILTGKD